MLCHKCKHFGPEFQVVYVSCSSKGSSLNLDCWHLKMWTWRRSPHSTAGSRCGWFLSSLLAVHNLSSLFSSSSHLSGCTASLLEPGRQKPVLSVFTLQKYSEPYSGKGTFLFCLQFFSWKCCMCQVLGFLVFDAEPEVTPKKKSTRNFLGGMHLPISFLLLVAKA